MYKLSTLKNAKILTCHLPQMKSVSVGVWIKAGGLYEPAKQSGISHFIEHLVFKGTKSRNYQQLKEAIEGSGGMLNAFTSEEYTCFFVKILSQHLSKSIDILLDMVFNAMFSPADITKERLVVFEEIKMYFDLPQHLANDGLVSLLWPEHALGRSLLGSFETLKTISRTEIISYIHKHYCLDNMLISCSGNIAHNLFINKVNYFLKKYKIKAKQNFKDNKYDCPKIKQNSSQIKIVHKQIEQMHICLGFHALHRQHHLRYALFLLHIILGANMSSRLFNEVREKKGLAYEIGSTIKLFQDAGVFVVHAGVINDKLVPAVKVIFSEVKRLTKYLVLENEFTRAKEYYRGQILMGLEDNLEHMFWASESVLTKGRIELVSSIIKKVNAVERKDIRDVARMIFKKINLNLSVVGPLTKEQSKKLNISVDTF
ncbi:MAG: hypothetical protein DRP78_05345 [Candidatus Omnitrophota bacterium]|nr:MAG: hypothetical protein DRP78_05345 [Candidatus Omnitrophota bacterium]